MGAPKGNKNAANRLPVKQTIWSVLETYQTGTIAQGQALRQICTVLVEQALEGDKDARAEIFNRLDGKPSQSLDVTQTVTHVSDRAQLLLEASRIYAQYVGVDDGRRVIEAVGDSSGTGPALIEAQD